MPPQVEIEGYELAERIGAGAESMIFRAVERASKEVVAIKWVCVENAESYKYLRHAENEYERLKALEGGEKGHPPGVVRARRLIKSGFLRKRKSCALVMDYVDGLDLRRERRYPLGQLVEMMRHVAGALSAIHARGLIHGDLKPENIIVTHGGRPVLVDFGFCCESGSCPQTIRGTRDYMAPEQVDRRPLTEKTDIFNFGATMYFLFSGRHVPALMAEPGSNKLFIAGRNLDAPPMRTFNPGVPPALDGVVLRCVRQDIVERPSCIDEVREGLSGVIERCFGDRSALAATPPPPPAPETA
jgi:serine/threonine-protein kinase